MPSAQEWKARRDRGEGCPSVYFSFSCDWYVTHGIIPVCPHRNTQVKSGAAQAPVGAAPAASANTKPGS